MFNYTSSFRCKQIIVFSLTFISYALYHSTRKNITGVKQNLKKDWINSTFVDEDGAKKFLGALDSTFMIAYSIFLVVFGWLGDRMNPLYLVVLGMFGSAASLMLVFYVPSYFQFYSKPYYFLGNFFFGVVQALGWPNEVTIMSNWFYESNRGLILGFWATCQSFGNILSLLICAAFPLEYLNSFLTNAILILIFGILMYIFVSKKPSESNLNQSSESSIRLPTFETNLNVISEPRRKVTLLQAIRLPTVLPYCLCNACLKFVNYAFFYWLPMYLNFKLKKENPQLPNQLSIFFDIGGIIGSIIGGYISDKLGRRSPVIMSMLVASLPLLIIYTSISSSILLHAFMLTVIGITVSGPYNLIVGTISVDLGSQPAIAGNTDAMSTVTGIIDATGSAGAAIGQILIPIIEGWTNWDMIVYIFVIMNILSMLTLVNRFIIDCLFLCKKQNLNTNDYDEDCIENQVESAPLLTSENS